MDNQQTEHLDVKDALKYELSDVKWQGAAW